LSIHQGGHGIDERSEKRIGAGKPVVDLQAGNLTVG